jgi:hypothetical protein
VSEEPEEICPRCGGEERRIRQQLSQIVLTHLVCQLCHRSVPILEEDTEQNTFREIPLPPVGPEENTSLPRSLRDRRLMGSAPDPGRVYKIMGHDRGWTRVDLGNGREAWIRPDGKLLLEALD